MSTAENKAIVRRMVTRGMIDGNLDEAIGAYAPDFGYHNPVLRDRPFPPGGPEAVRRICNTPSKR